MCCENQIRKSGSNKVPQVGAIHVVVKEVVNLIGASGDAGEKREEVEAFGGGPRAAPGFDDLHRFVFPECSRSFESGSHVKDDRGVFFGLGVTEDMFQCRSIYCWHKHFFQTI